MICLALRSGTCIIYCFFVLDCNSKDLLNHIKLILMYILRILSGTYCFLHRSIKKFLNENRNMELIFLLQWMNHSSYNNKYIIKNLSIIMLNFYWSLINISLRKIYHPLFLPFANFTLILFSIFFWYSNSSVC